MRTIILMLGLAYVDEDGVTRYEYHKALRFENAEQCDAALDNLMLHKGHGYCTPEYFAPETSLRPVARPQNDG